MNFGVQKPYESIKLLDLGVQKAYVFIKCLGFGVQISGTGEKKQRNAFTKPNKSEKKIILGVLKSTAH